MPKRFKQCPEHMPRAFRASDAPAMLHDAPRNAQTDRQTYKHLTTLASYLTLGIARRGVAGFSPSRFETTRPAALRAGHIKAGSRA